MCQEVQLPDIRSVLRDQFDGASERTAQLADLLAHFDEPHQKSMLHALEHAQRAKSLAAAGDRNAASIHEALLANMAREAS